MTNQDRLVQVNNEISILEVREKEAEKALNWSLARKELDYATLDLKEWNDICKRLDVLKKERDQLIKMTSDERHSEVVELIS